MSWTWTGGPPQLQPAVLHHRVTAQVGLHMFLILLCVYEHIMLALCVLTIYEGLLFHCRNDVSKSLFTWWPQARVEQTVVC